MWKLSDPGIKFMIKILSIEKYTAKQITTYKKMKELVKIV